MKFEVFCAWGDGPDVGIHALPSKEEKEFYDRPVKSFIMFDLTSEQAKKLAHDLINAAREADECTELANQYYEEEKE